MIIGKSTEKEQCVRIEFCCYKVDFKMFLDNIS